MITPDSGEVIKQVQKSELVFSQSENWLKNSHLNTFSTREEVTIGCLSSVNTSSFQCRGETTHVKYILLMCVMAG